jgi:hypothetical protein
LFRDEGEFKSRRAADAGLNLGGGFDIVSAANCGASSRRAATRANAFLPASAKPRRRLNSRCAKGFILQCRERAGTAAHQPHCRAAQKNRARRRAREPERRGAHARQNHHRHLRKQIRHSFEQVEGVYARASKLKNLRLRGVQMHIGSQLTSVAV